MAALLENLETIHNGSLFENTSLSFSFFALIVKATVEHGAWQIGCISGLQ